LLLLLTRTEISLNGASGLTLTAAPSPSCKGTISLVLAAQRTLSLRYQNQGKCLRCLPRKRISCLLLRRDGSTGFGALLHQLFLLARGISKMSILYFTFSESRIYPLGKTSFWRCLRATSYTNLPFQRTAISSNFPLSICQ
jgi:hypothetical protein